MWKDFFYYSKSERRAVFVLLVLIALFVLGIVFSPQPEIPLTTEVVEKDSFEIKTKEVEKEMPIVALRPFDPNLADSLELSGLGLSSFVVRNVLKYRAKGGRFHTPASFARVYGLTEEKYKELEPYIRISTSPHRKTSVAKKSPVEKRIERKDTVSVVKKTFKYPEGTLVNVNLADTNELKKIPGIGSGIARTIVNYRNRLGGFCSLEQLEEIDYITPEMLKWFKLEEISLRKLNINQAGLDKLRAHPYLNFYQAKVILEHRRKKGKITSLSQLALYEEFTEKDLKRLSAYIQFD